MPSDTVMVPNSMANPPAANTPSLARAASLRNVTLQGVTSFHDEAIATCGLSQSASVMPTARSIARAGAFCMPSVTSRERGLMSTGVSTGCSAMAANLLAPGPEAEEVLGHLAHLDLLRPLGDAVPTVVAVDVLERHVPAVAHAAAGLHRPVRRLARQPVGAVVAHRHE